MRVNSITIYKIENMKITITPLQEFYKIQFLLVQCNLTISVE